MEPINVRPRSVKQREVVWSGESEMGMMDYRWWKGAGGRRQEDYRWWKEVEGGGRRL